MKRNAASLGNVRVVKRETASLGDGLIGMWVTASLGKRLLVEGNVLVVAGRSVERRNRVS